MCMGVYRVDTILKRGVCTHPKWKALPIPKSSDFVARHMIVGDESG